MFKPVAVPVSKTGRSSPLDFCGPVKQPLVSQARFQPYAINTSATMSRVSGPRGAPADPPKLNLAVPIVQVDDKDDSDAQLAKLGQVVQRLRICDEQRAKSISFVLQTSPLSPRTGSEIPSTKTAQLSPFALSLGDFMHLGFDCSMKPIFAMQDRESIPSGHERILKWIQGYDRELTATIVRLAKCVSCLDLMTKSVAPTSNNSRPNAKEMFELQHSTCTDINLCSSYHMCCTTEIEYDVYESSPQLSSLTPFGDLSTKDAKEQTQAYFDALNSGGRASTSPTDKEFFASVDGMIAKLANLHALWSCHEIHHGDQSRLTITLLPRLRRGSGNHGELVAPTAKTKRTESKETVSPVSPVSPTKLKIDSGSSSAFTDFTTQNHAFSFGDSRPVVEMDVGAL